MDKANTNSKIASLIDGYKRFNKKYFEGKGKTFSKLVKHGQKPKALVIACCDSRADPAIITDCNPGELFVVRNVANLVPPFEGDPYHHGTSAALEFGIKDLEIKDIIVLGHSHCGGINALLDENCTVDHNDFVSSWIDIASTAKDKVLKEFPNATHDEKVHICSKQSLMISLENLKTFPWIKKRVDEKKLFLHAWFFCLETGLIETYDEASDKFIVLGE
jgi:carbonic anhydrase